MSEFTQCVRRETDDCEQLQDWVDGFMRPFADLSLRANSKDPAPFGRGSVRMKRSGSMELRQGGWFGRRS
jgi:hypothetical protein